MLENILDQAWQKRQNLFSQAELNCYRVLHGFGEGLPGINIDRYGELTIVEYKQDLPTTPEQFCSALRQLYPFRWVIFKAHHLADKRLHERFRIFGDDLPTTLTVREGPMQFAIDPLASHNVGLYLDARRARQWLTQNSSDRRVLNLFAFTGSLGIAAAVGGARSVVHVDKGSKAQVQLTQNYTLNNLNYDDRCYLRGDIYHHLPRAIKSQKTFDGIILDPPPKVHKSRHMRHTPVDQDIPTLVQLASQLLSPSGWLMCLFHHYGKEQQAFVTETLAASNQPLSVVWQDTSDEDFPESNPDDKLKIVVFKAAHTRSHVPET